MKKIYKKDKNLKSYHIYITWNPKSTLFIFILWKPRTDDTQDRLFAKDAYLLQ